MLLGSRQCIGMLFVHPNTKALQLPRSMLCSLLCSFLCRFSPSHLCTFLCSHLCAYIQYTLSTTALAVHDRAMPQTETSTALTTFSKSRSSAASLLFLSLDHIKSIRRDRLILRAPDRISGSGRMQALQNHAKKSSGQTRGKPLFRSATGFAGLFQPCISTAR